MKPPEHKTNQQVATLKRILNRARLTPGILQNIFLGLVIGICIGLVVLSVNKYIVPLVNQPEGEKNKVGYSGDHIVGTQAPDFVLQNISGQKVHLSDYNDKIVAVNFWATWCGPCVFEMPLLQELQDQYAPNLTVLAINNQESADAVVPFIEQLGVSYEVLLDSDGSVHNKYMAFYMPTTVFIDQEGIIRSRHIGIISEEAFIGYMNELGEG